MCVCVYMHMSVYTSLLQVCERPEHSVGQLALCVEEGGHATARLIRVLHLGAKLIHDVPDGHFFLC